MIVNNLILPGKEMEERGGLLKSLYNFKQGKMEMTGVQIQLVKRSWTLFRGINPATIGDVFYSRVFLKAPGLKKMFPSGMQDQYTRMFDMVSLFVGRLDRMEEMTEYIRQTALRNKHNGVRNWHYEVVGDALLWTLERGLGHDWNEEIREAWTNCYATLSREMMQWGEANKVKG